MCLAVFIASAEPLATAEWKEGRGVMFEDLRSEHAGVRKQFAHPHVYYVTSSEGCGCGFLTRYHWSGDPQEGLPDRRALSRLIEDDPTSDRRFQLLIAYDGYETKTIDTRWRMDTEDLVDCDFDEGWDFHVILVDLA